MNKKVWLLGLSMGCLMGATAQAWSTNLLDVYQQALRNDPQFAAARSTWLASHEDTAIARAALLPQIDLGGNALRSHAHTDSSTFANTTVGGDDSYNSYAYGIQLTQPIINFSAWHNVAVAKASTKSADAAFAFAAQTLMVDVSTAYFNVLQNQDDLRLTQAQKRADYSQLEQNRERYKVGIDTITDVYDAQAAYDEDISQEISDKNNLANAKEALRRITGVYYNHLDGVQREVPLVRPKPANIDNWSQTSLKQNMEVLSARYEEIASREAVKVASSGNYPVLNAVADWDQTYSGADSNAGSSTGDVQTASAGFDVTVPIFQGGAVSATTHQALYNYQTASNNLEASARKVVDETRSTYNDVVSGISKIRADKQAILSNKSAYITTLDSYKVGTRTMVDVLDAQTSVVQSQRTLVEDKYALIIDTLLLKQAAGTLTVKDLKTINQWLGRGYSRLYNPNVDTIHPNISQRSNHTKHSKVVTKQQSQAKKLSA